MGRVAAATLVSVCALAACTGDPAPIVTDLPTVSPSPVASVTPTPDPSASLSPIAAPLSDEQLLALMPPGAGQADAFGALVTAQFFLEQYAPMFHTGDTRVWEALSAEGCGYCADALENAERVRDEGWTARGGEIVVDEDSIEAAMTGDAEASVLLTSALSDAYLSVPGEGERLTSEAGQVVFGIRLEIAGSRWAVIGVSSEDSQE